MKVSYLPILVVLFAALPAIAQPTQSTESAGVTPGAAKATQTVRATAVVVNIVKETRTISLKRADGNTVEVHAGEEVRNFDKIKVGDKVTAEYSQVVSLKLKKGGGEVATRTESGNIERAPVGAQPKATMGRRVEVLADVVAVNAKDKIVTLRGPDDKTAFLNVQDPIQLERIKQGDQVHVVYQEALALAVEPQGLSGK